MNKNKYPPLSLAWFVWGLGASLYLMGFFQRVAPAVMTDELMRDFGITAAALGNLSAFYFYSYVAMQIPTGIIADRWGPRRLLATGALVAGLGTTLFALSPGIFWAGLGRFLIGGSVAVAFVGLLKVANRWFPPRYYALVSGMALLCGLVGAVFAGPPLRGLIDLFGWRQVLLITALATFGISLAVWLFVRDHPHEKGYSDLVPSGSDDVQGGRSGIWAGIREVLLDRNSLLLTVAPSGIVGCVLTFSGLWGVPFLTTHYRLPVATASTLTSAALLAWGLGGPVFGWLSDRLGARKPIYIVGSSVALIGWILIVYVAGLPMALLVPILVITGFSSGCMVVGFAYAKESVPPRLSGTVSGIVNTGVMTGPMLLQPAVGWMLDYAWQGQMAGGIRIYGLGAYRAGFSLMIIWAAVALVMLLCTRETHCRQKV